MLNRVLFQERQESTVHKNPTIDIPEWHVIANGRIVGIVAGTSVQDALETATECPKFDRYSSLTVRKAN